MKTIGKVMALTISAIFLTRSVWAQQDDERSISKKKYEVVTQLKETCGTFNQRKIYRNFLLQAMKECPFISNFHIIQLKDSHDNCYVDWVYNVNKWSDITHFYEWIFSTIHSSKDSILSEALSPYGPNYGIGGAIEMRKLSKAMAKH